MNGLSFSISRILISRMTAIYGPYLSNTCEVFLMEPVPVNFLKYKSLENFHLYAVLFRGGGGGGGGRATTKIQGGRGAMMKCCAKRSCTVCFQE